MSWSGRSNRPIACQEDVPQVQTGDSINLDVVFGIRLSFDTFWH